MRALRVLDGSRKDNPKNPVRIKNKVLGSAIGVTTQVPKTVSPLGLPGKDTVIVGIDARR
jgi:hypothetical protein